MELTNLVWQIQDFLVIILITFIALYIYLAIAVRDSAKKLGVPKEWASISWFGSTIPYLMANSARKHWWPALVLPVAISILSLFGTLYNVFNILTVLFMIVFLGYMIYLKWEICELRDIHGWWALVSPGLVLLAIVLVAISEGLGIVSTILIILSFIWYLVLWGILAWSK